MHTCELCNFNSPSKSNYEKHCQTQKHKKNIEKQATQSQPSNISTAIPELAAHNPPLAETKEEPCNAYTIPDPPKQKSNTTHRTTNKTTTSTEYNYEHPPYNPSNPDANTFPFAPPDLEELIRQFIPYGLNVENIRAAFETASNSGGHRSKSSSRKFPFSRPFSKSNKRSYSYTHSSSSDDTNNSSNPFKFTPPAFSDNDQPYTSNSYSNTPYTTSSSSSSSSSKSSTHPYNPTNTTTTNNTSNVHTTHSTLNMPVFGGNDLDLGSFSDNPFGSRNISISSEAPMPDDVIQELLQKKEITQLAPEKQSHLKKLISNVCKTKNIITRNNTKTTTTNNTTVTTRSNNEFTLNIFMNNECRLRIDITELAMSIIGEDTNIMDNIPEYLNTIIKVLIPIIIQMIRDREFDI